MEENQVRLGMEKIGTNFNFFVFGVVFGIAVVVVVNVPYC